MYKVYSIVGGSQVLFKLHVTLKLRMNRVLVMNRIKGVLDRVLVIVLLFKIFCIGVTHRHLSDHMSELVENTLSDLDQSKVIWPCKKVQSNIMKVPSHRQSFICLRQLHLTRSTDIAGCWDKLM